MNTLLFTALLQTSLTSMALPARSAIENPAAVSQVPQKSKKDYDKLWARFLTGKEDAKVLKDLDKLLKKQKALDAANVVKAYIDLYKGDEAAARHEFTLALSTNSKNRLALYYLGEMAYARSDYLRAADLYAQLLKVDATRPDVETKRQRALLLATDELVRAATRAEADNRLADAEQYYRRSLSIAPTEPTLHARLAALLAKQNKKEEAEAEAKMVELLSPRRTAPAAPVRDQVKADSLEDLGRWGSDIGVFHEIRDAQVISREQFAMLLLRYFPQATEFRQRPQIITDIENSRAKSEIQIVVGVGLIDTLPNHTFAPGGPLTRADLATALARLSRLLGLPPAATQPITATDVASTSAQYSEIQLVLGFGLLALENSGSFNVSGYVSGQEAVHSEDRLLRIFQQPQR